MSIRKLTLASLLLLAVFPAALSAEEVPAPAAAVEPVPWCAETLPVAALLSCSATSTCSDGTVIHCECPGTGTCTDGGTWVECICDGAPDDEELCPGPSCPPPGSKCIAGKSCGGTCADSVCGGGSCIRGQCNCEA